MCGYTQYMHNTIIYSVLMRKVESFFRSEQSEWQNMRILCWLPRWELAIYMIICKPWQIVSCHWKIIFSPKFMENICVLSWLLVELLMYFFPTSIQSSQNDFSHLKENLQSTMAILVALASLTPLISIILSEKLR